MENNKIQVEILGVNNEADLIRYSIDGKESTATVIKPADIKYAREGKAQIQINEAGYICYLRMDPGQKTAYTKTNFQNSKPMNYATGKDYQKSNSSYSKDNGTSYVLSYVKDLVVAGKVKMEDLKETASMMLHEIYLPLTRGEKLHIGGKQ